MIDVMWRGRDHHITALRKKEADVLPGFDLQYYRNVVLARVVFNERKKNFYFIFFFLLSFVVKEIEFFHARKTRNRADAHRLCLCRMERKGASVRPMIPPKRRELKKSLSRLRDTEQKRQESIEGDDAVTPSTVLISVPIQSWPDERARGYRCAASGYPHHRERNLRKNERHETQNQNLPFFARCLLKNIVFQFSSFSFIFLVHVYKTQCVHIRPRVKRPSVQTSNKDI